MTQSTTCPSCGATMWRGSLHCCPRREPQRVEKPGSSALTIIALWTFAGVVCLAAGWALNSVFGVF